MIDPPVGRSVNEIFLPKSFGDDAVPRGPADLDGLGVGAPAMSRSSRTERPNSIS